MKFAHDLEALEKDAPECLRGHFLAYKQLKKLIKALPGEEDRSEAEQKFFKRLREEVLAVNERFETSTGEVLWAASRRHRKQRVKNCCLPILRRKRSTLNEEELLAKQAEWCRQYAKVNAAGLRKIAKKHDKRLSNDAGHRFVQACWDVRNEELGAFLHSPLMAELKALEQLRDGGVGHRSTGCAPPSCLTSGSSSQLQSPTLRGLPSPAVAASPALSSQREESLEPLDIGAGRLSRDTMGSVAETMQAANSEAALICGICLEPMYQPLGLGCGHKFCTECVMRGTGCEDPLQPLRKVLASMPASASCPKCRQRAVFRSAVELQKLGAFIFARYPEEITVRATAAAEKLGAARHQKAQQQRADMQSRMDRYFQPFGYGI